MLITEMMTAEDLIWQMKKEFRRVCNPNTLELD